jgi:hypothetical protein
VTDTTTNRIRRIEHEALQATASRLVDDPPAYAISEQLIRELHRECPAATSAELAAAEAWIRKCCGC